MRSRAAAPLAYAFSTDGWLDPGTKLLDIGLDGVTPIGALRDLQTNPLHMSIALHEITHFVSLENTLGHAMSFLAMRAQTIGDGLLEHVRQHTEVHPSFITLYAAWHMRYRQLVELWRPLLEGLAVYAQTHVPDPTRDELIDPLPLLWQWRLVIEALSESRNAGVVSSIDSVDGGFLRGAYQAIAQGPGLLLGEHSLAASLEFSNPPGLRPYFLGHAYLRAVQRELARACPDYAVNELFFQLLIRVLRSSTRDLLAKAKIIDQPSAARGVYGWIDIVRKAPAERVAHLRKQPDAVDVLHFLSTGEVRSGYSGQATDDVAVLRELMPNLWQDFESALADRHPEALTGAGSSQALAQRLTGHWLRGTMALNLSSNGTTKVAGWVERGFDPLHALALKVDDALWWVAGGDDDVAVLAGDTHLLPCLPREALWSSYDVAASGPEVAIDCFVRYAPMPPALAQALGKSRMFPDFGFELVPRAGEQRPLLTELEPAKLGQYRSHLRVVRDAERIALHRSTMQMRRIVRDTGSPAELAMQFDESGDTDTATALRDLDEAEHLSAARVQAQVERRIVAGLLQGESGVDTATVLEGGLGGVEGAALLEPLITAAYGRRVVAVPGAAEAAQWFNARAQAAIGVTPFEVDSARQTICYCGLWGGPGPTAATSQPGQPEKQP